MTRTPSSASHQSTQAPPSAAAHNVRTPSFQGQMHQQPRQPQSAQPTLGPFMPYERQRTTGQTQPIMQFQTQQDYNWQFDTTAYGLGYNPYLTRTTYDQQSQAPQSRPQEMRPPRPHTAPDPNSDFPQVQMALFDQSSQIPPAPDDFDVDQYLAGMGTGPNLPQSSPDTSNGPRTPNQSVPPPSIAVDNESDDEEVKVQALTDIVAEEVRMWIQQHGKRNQEASRLIATRDLPSILASIASSKSGRGSTSAFGSSRKSLTGSASSRASKTSHICPKCQRLCNRQSDLKKHMKRHSRPYGCVLDKCYKRFGSKNDLQRHENKTHPEQMECYRCDGNHREAGQPCFKVFYDGRDNYKKHLEKCYSQEVQQIEKQANASRIPANNLGRFWCGFCNKIVAHDPYATDASKVRLRHIDAHFSQGKWAADWIELGGNGLTKAEVEIKENQVRNEQIRARELNASELVGEDEGQRSSSPSTSPENQDDMSQSQGATTAHSMVQQRNPAPVMQRHHSNTSQMSQQSRPQQQMPHPMQRARSQGQMMYQVVDLQHSPRAQQRPQGQRVATRAKCCQCHSKFTLDLSRRCIQCEHEQCPACQLRWTD